MLLVSFLKKLEDLSSQQLGASWSTVTEVHVLKPIVYLLVLSRPLLFSTTSTCSSLHSILVTYWPVPLFQDISPVDMFVYTDDSMYVKYSDGTSLQLSPCGSVFLHYQSTSKPCHQHQLTRFAISKYHNKIAEALKVRNQFAERPYLCKELCDQANMVTYILIIPSFCAIPGSVLQCNRSDLVHVWLMRMTAWPWSYFIIDYKVCSSQ